MRPVCLLDRAKNLHQSDRLHFISDSLSKTALRLPIDIRNAVFGRRKAGFSLLSFHGYNQHGEHYEKHEKFVGLHTNLPLSRGQYSTALSTVLIVSIPKEHTYDKKIHLTSLCQVDFPIQNAITASQSKRCADHHPHVQTRCVSPAQNVQSAHRRLPHTAFDSKGGMPPRRYGDPAQIAQYTA